jgi:hypothetical protein
VYDEAGADALLQRARFVDHTPVIATEVHAASFRSRFGKELLGILAAAVDTRTHPV